MSHILDPLRELLQVQPEADCTHFSCRCYQAGYNLGLREALVSVGRELDRAVQEAEWVPPIGMEEALRDRTGILGGSSQAAREYMGAKVAPDGFLEPAQYKPWEPPKTVWPPPQTVGGVIRDAAGIKWVRREKQQPDGLLAVWWEVASE